MNAGRRKIINLVFIMAITLMLCGCGRKQSYKELTLDYLNKNFASENDNFTYISCDFDLFPGWNERCYFKSEKYSETITVKVSKGGNSFSNNYYHVVYDDKITEIYQNGFTDNYKIYVSSDNRYSDKKCNDIYEYLKDIYIYDVYIYTTSGYEINKIKENLKNIIDSIGVDNYITVIVYEIPNEYFTIVNKESDFSNYFSLQLQYKNGVLIEL